MSECMRRESDTAESERAAFPSFPVSCIPLKPPASPPAPFLPHSLTPHPTCSCSHAPTSHVARTPQERWIPYERSSGQGRRTVRTLVRQRARVIHLPRARACTPCAPPVITYSSAHMIHAVLICSGKISPAPLTAQSLPFPFKSDIATHTVPAMRERRDVRTTHRTSRFRRSAA